MNRFLRYTTFLGLLLFAMLLASAGRTLAQAQPQLVSVYRTTPLPLADPMAADWDSVPGFDVALIAQAVAAPRLMDITIPSVRVQSLNDGKNIVFRLAWKDATQDWFASHLDEFRDAAAIQTSVAQTLPSFCMGAPGQLVNLWHWKADWQYDIDKGFRDVVDAYPNFWLDYYPLVVGSPPYRLPKDFDAPAKSYVVGWTAGNPLSNPVRVTPVEDLNAVGFGSAASQAKQDVQGRGVWKDSSWFVVFSRAMQSADSNDGQFVPGQTTSVAFAVWDGAEKQVGARKQLSTWVPMVVEKQVASNVESLGLSVAAIIGLVIVVGFLVNVLVDRRWLR